MIQLSHFSLPKTELPFACFKFILKTQNEIIIIFKTEARDFRQIDKQKQPVK